MCAGQEIDKKNQKKKTEKRKKWEKNVFTVCFRHISVLCLFKEKCITHPHQSAPFLRLPFSKLFTQNIIPKKNNNKTENKKLIEIEAKEKKTNAKVLMACGIQLNLALCSLIMSYHEIQSRLWIQNTIQPYYHSTRKKCYRNIIEINYV